MCRAVSVLQSSKVTGRSFLPEPWCGIKGSFLAPWLHPSRATCVHSLFVISCDGCQPKLTDQFLIRATFLHILAPSQDQLLWLYIKIRFIASKSTRSSGFGKENPAKITLKEEQCLVKLTRRKDFSIPGLLAPN